MTPHRLTFAVVPVPRLVSDVICPVVLTVAARLVTTLPVLTPETVVAGAIGNVTPPTVIEPAVVPVAWVRLVTVPLSPSGVCAETVVTKNKAARNTLRQQEKKMDPLLSLHILSFLP